MFKQSKQSTSVIFQSNHFTSALRNSNNSATINFSFKIFNGFFGSLLVFFTNNFREVQTIRSYRNIRCPPRGLLVKNTNNGTNIHHLQKNARTTQDPGRKNKFFETIVSHP